MSSFDFNRFEVRTVSSKKWFDEYYRINVKLHDRFGHFGADRFDYFVCSSKEDIRKNGCSKAYIMIQNKRSIQYLRGEVEEKVRKTMKEKFGIDISEVVDKDEVIYAYDSNPSVVVGRNGLTMFFPDLRNINPDN